MSSDEVSNSGKFSGGRSNFSQMCTLLSQYLKARGSFGDLKLGFEPKGSETETMNLFPMIENLGLASGSSNPNMLAPASDDSKKTSFLSAQETAQMTIFYGGQVMVFDDFPVDKAENIIRFASSKPSAAQSPSASATGFGGVQLPAQSPLDSDLPIARKISLARFLEKRKDRITANAPYPYPASKPRAEAWLLPLTSAPSRTPSSLARS